MNKKISSALFLICTILFSTSTYADSSSSHGQNEETQIQTLTAETKALTEQTKELKAELAEMRSEMHAELKMVKQQRAISATLQSKLKHLHTEQKTNNKFPNAAIAALENMPHLNAGSSLSMKNAIAQSMAQNSVNSSTENKTMLAQASSNDTSSNDSSSDTTTATSSDSTSSDSTSNLHNESTSSDTTPTSDSNPTSSSSSPDNPVNPDLTDTQRASLKNLYLLYYTPQYLTGIPVIISPYLGAPPAYNASDLIINFSGVNSDLLVIQERQSLENVYTQNNIPIPTNAFAALSGGVTGQFTTASPYVGRFTSTIDLTSANLSFIGGINRWITTFTTVDFDSTSPTQEIPPRSAPLVNNSRFYLDQGFLTLGNLNLEDWYGTIGQFYLPFGKYSGFLVSGTLTSDMFLTRGRGALVGFSHSFKNNNTLDAQVYAFNGDPNESVFENAVNTFGANIDLGINRTKWSAGLGGGVISDIADSAAMQLTGAPIFPIANTGVNTFAGFAQSGETLEWFVPGADVNGTLTLGKFTFSGEYMGALTHFALRNLGFNLHGARPASADMEASYKFNIMGRPSSFSIGYGNTAQSLVLILPYQSYGATFSTSWWRSTVFSVGIVYDIDYPVGSEASGQRAGIGGQGPSLGKTSTSEMATFSAYF